MALACSHPELDEYLAFSSHLDPSPLLSASGSSHDIDLDIDDLLEDDPSIHPFREPDSSQSDDHILHRLCSITVPDPTITDEDYLTTCAHTLDPGTKALHALDIALQHTGQSRSFYYAALRRDEPLLNFDAPVRAHMDGGAMASTTNRLDLLWHLQWIPSTQHHLITLKVADNRSHHPTAIGCLHIPTSDSLGYRLITCYYTPTLPATIISPDAMGVQLDCSGYTSVSNFDGSDCSVRLRHCRRVSEDIVIPLLLVRGLLYTYPLLPPPNKILQLSRPSPPILHVREVTINPSTDKCSCCATSSPASTTSTDLAEKLLYYQRTGFQLDVSVTDLAQSADGVPSWSPVCSCCSSTDSHSSTEDGEGSVSPVVESAPSSSPEDGEGLASASSKRSTSSCSLSVEELMFAPVETNKRYVLHHLGRDQLRILWHQRLGHMHSRRVSNMHRYADGIPKVSIATELEKCPICIQAKLRKANRGQTDSRHATQCNQGLSIDFGFIVQKSKKGLTSSSMSSTDTTRFERLRGLNGETCYCLIVDHFSGTLYGETFCSKAPPLDFINRWLAQHGLPKEILGKYVRFDLGGELGRSPAVVALFNKAGYTEEPTAPDSSHQNGPGERPHQTIADALRAMLGGAALQPKFWPYAFQHFIRLYNVTVHRGHSASPFEICSGLRPNLRFLRVFGCRVYALPARPRRPDKIVSDARVGIFLGYSKTMKNILYYDSVSSSVKTAQHVAFDETMNDLDDKPPNARMLDGLQNGQPDVLDAGVILPDLDVSFHPFSRFTTVTVSLEPDSDSPLGFDLDTCDRLHRAFISAVHRPLLGRTLRASKSHKGSYLVSINGFPVFTLQDVNKIIADLCSTSPVPSTVEILLAPEQRAAFDDRPSPLHLRMHDLRRVCALQHVSSEGKTSTEFNTALHDFDADLTDVEMSEVIHRLQTETMTMEERRLKRFTRRNLLRLPNWSSWDTAFDAQLDAHRQAGTLGTPIPRPKSIDGRPANVLRIQWSNLVKSDGTRKCRACIDGSKRAAPWLHQFAQTYASCVEQPCMRLFFAVSAAKSLIVTFADTTNAFQQSPPPSEQCYLAIDDAYCSWYKKRFGIAIDPRTHVIPVKRALQGHPEAGALWENMIVGILEGPELAFKSTTHERNLYRGTIDGEMVLVCRQVDDFAIASASPLAAEKLIAIINSHATTTNLGIGIKSRHGVASRYNGIDVHQTRDYIKVSCATYLQRLLQTHGWDTPAHHESDRFDLTPLASSSAESLLRLVGPAEDTPEHCKLQDDCGFSYRQLLGELVYAYTVCRLDIGYAITLLSSFSHAPARAHYLALKSLVKYLRRNMHWGIVYWRETPVLSLPAVPLEQPVVDPTLPSFPKHDFLQLYGNVDAAHATDIPTRRSITCLVFCLAGGAIAYKSKRQTTVATSSTEAEFIAAVHAAKTAKYLRSVLADFGFPQLAPTPIYNDNEAAIAMINQCKPTPRSRHIDIQHFAIQEWRRQGAIIMHHIPGVVNCSDAGTKALGWTLHSRHVRRSMGHYGPPL